jgi:hypothetical protein
VAPHLTVSDAARALSERLDPIVRPRDVSSLFYHRELRDDLCPIIGGRRLIPADYLPLIEMALRHHGYKPKRETETAT